MLFFFIQGWRRFPTVSTPAFARMRSETDEAKEQRSGGVGFRFQLWVVFGAVTGKCFCGIRLSRRYRYVPYSEMIELHHTSVYLDRGKELHKARNSIPSKSTALGNSFFFFIYTIYSDNDRLDYMQSFRYLRDIRIGRMLCTGWAARTVLISWRFLP